MEVAGDWQAVADAINARMVRLRLTQRELSERSGVSLSTLRELQHGEKDRRRSARTLAAVSDALGWGPDYLHRIATGERPRTNDQSEDRPADDEVLAELQEIREQLTEIARRVDRLAGRDPDGPERR